MPVSQPNRNRSLNSEEIKLILRAEALSRFTIIYNVIEGAVSIGYGIQDNAIALAGFGGDSVIEVLSALVVIWRFRGAMGRELGQDAELSLERERRSTLYIGILFALLAVITAIAAGLQLNSGTHPSTTFPGMVIASVSLSFMLYLWSAKMKLARMLDSSTVKKDADCTLACIKLSGVLFVGSTLHLFVPSLWWIDAGAAILIAGFIGKEGWDTIRAARSLEFSGGCGCSK
jgi:hypothetical protein